jgi:hypothetical protein
MSEYKTVYAQELNSSMVKYGEYDPNTMELTITFQNGIQYVYTDIEEFVAKEFFAADSNGKYFNENIKKNYKFNKL